MKDDYQTYIEDYLRGRLSGPALLEFEQMLATDKELADETARLKEDLGYVEAIANYRMKERVKRLVAQKKPNRGGLFLFFSRPWVIAASLLFVATICLFSWLRPPLQERLFEAYYEPYPINLGSNRGSADGLASEAGDLFAQGAYAEAAPLLQALLAEKPSDSKTRMALAIALVETGKDDDALAQLAQLIGSDEQLYLGQAIWYSALLKLKKGDRQGCKALLQQLIGSPNTALKGKAEGLLKQLEQ